MTKQKPSRTAMALTIGCGGLLATGGLCCTASTLLWRSSINEMLGGVAAPLPSLAGDAGAGPQRPPAPGPLHVVPGGGAAYYSVEVELVSVVGNIAASPGSHCSLSFVVEASACRATLDCAEQRLYGANGGGLIPCQLNPVLVARDPDPTSRDGDPSLVASGADGRFEFNDDAAGAFGVVTLTGRIVAVPTP